MRNRAKCKKCQSIIESFHRNDYVTCKCGEISVDGGSDYLRCHALDFSNFLRVDDEGNEIVVTVKVKTKDESIQVIKESTDQPLPKKKELVEMLYRMIEDIEKLPSTAMLNPINHYDFVSLLFLLSSIFKFDCKDDN